MARKRQMVRRVNPDPLPPDVMPSPAPSARLFVEGPLEEARDVETPWGVARAEVGCYVLENEETGAAHVVPPEDFELLYGPPG